MEDRSGWGFKKAVFSVRPAANWKEKISGDETSTCTKCLVIRKMSRTTKATSSPKQRQQVQEHNIIRRK